MMGGWSSNNKYALLGAFRTVAQLVSYEAPMILSLLVPVILARSMDLNEIVRQQQVWFLFSAPIAALLFFISSVAEVGRTPFDLLEAESEIVAGFHIEYSGMKFGMFFVAEFLHAFTVGMLVAVLFMGGWRGPGAEQYPLLGVLYFVIKAFIAYFLVILLRGSLPRIRIDHMLDLNWKFLVPLALGTIVVTIITDKLVPAAWGPWGRAGVLFLANLLLAAVVFWIVSGAARRMRAAEEAGLGGPGAGEALSLAHGHEPAHGAAGEIEPHASPAH
jgi:NADH-quinone oxidoreductase subunit H